MKYFFWIVFSGFVAQLHARSIPVANVSELNTALKACKPGDTILLADKQWQDAAIKIEANGTQEHPIVIRPQHPGGAVLTGSSYIRLAGQYIVISGLHFSNGHTPRRAVIEFCLDENKLANHCRVTQCVIENYSQPARLSEDVWVCLWGRHNRVDHNTFVDKLNAGPTLIAELNDERSRENDHSIDSNYFKGRQRLGSNGGESIRIGVARYSLTASHTQIVHNYFERCNGEVEVVSIKSGENNVSHNVFYECEGGLVLRHGSKNLVSGNIFLGNDQPFTGGVRVINPGHTVTNNIFKDLTGVNFRSALAVLNGVPHSLINRYYQVTDVRISNNTFINCASVLFGAAKDEERILAPERVLFNKNLVVDPQGKPYTDENRDGGILFKDNAVAAKTQFPVTAGFTAATVDTVRKNGVLLPYSPNYGADVNKIQLISRSDAGALWYHPAEKAAARNPKVFKVKAAEAGKINELIQQALPGDRIVLSDTGYYKLDKEILINKPITIEGSNPFHKNPVLINTSYQSLDAFMIIENGGALTARNISFNGAFESYADVRSGIRSTSAPMNRHYKLVIDSCAFYNYNEGSYAGFRATKATYADSVIIRNSLFRNISGIAVNIAEEKEDKGLYGAENVVIQNCVFSEVLGSAINVYRGGNDESTTGPAVFIDHCTFSEVNNMEQGSVVKLIGVQNARITNSIFSSSGRGGRSIEFREYRWDNIHVNYCDFYRSGKIESFYGKAPGKDIYNVAPVFVNPPLYDFNLKEDLPAPAKSSDRKPLGASLVIE